jgi:hypothetical protein
LSVVLATPNTFATIRSTARHLREQTARDRLEVVIVCPSARELDLDEADVEGLASVHVVEIGKISSVGSANAAGVRRASAPVVALCESHAFPDPTWSETLMDAHSGPWVAVGPAVVNANPDSVVSWASFLVAYSQWMPPIESAAVSDLPGHNSSYKRAVLLERYGDRLADLLETESILHWDLRSAGHEIYLESAARTRHVNPSLFSSFLAELYHYGRLFAAARARGWPPVRRLVFTLCSPLIPILRMVRLLPAIRRARRDHGISAAVFPAVALGLMASGIGEAIGYARGPGRAATRMMDFEFHREKHVAKRDLQHEG